MSQTIESFVKFVFSESLSYTHTHEDSQILRHWIWAQESDGFGLKVVFKLSVVKVDCLNNNVRIIYAVF